jgi:hypothetical protein
VRVVALLHLGLLRLQPGEVQRAEDHRGHGPRLPVVGVKEAHTTPVYLRKPGWMPSYAWMCVHDPWMTYISCRGLRVRKPQHRPQTASSRGTLGSWKVGLQLWRESRWGPRRGRPACDCRINDVRQQHCTAQGQPRPSNAALRGVTPKAVPPRKPPQGCRIELDKPTTGSVSIRVSHTWCIKRTSPVCHVAIIVPSGRGTMAASCQSKGIYVSQMGAEMSLKS